MVAGGLIQIITSYNEHNLYLTDNPEISFFKTVYKRHTNFSFETVDEIFNNSSDFGKTCRLTIPKSGDLISTLTLHVKIDSLNNKFSNKLSKKTTQHNNFDPNCACHQCLKLQLGVDSDYGWVNSLGHVLINSCWIEIGGMKIDKQYGEWMEIWSELTQPYEKRQGYFQMINKVEPVSFNSSTFSDSVDLYIPLNFWFCKNYGLALPLISLYYQDVELVVDFRNFSECWVPNKAINNPPKKPNFDAHVLIQYIYLDCDERKRYILIIPSKNLSGFYKDLTLLYLMIGLIIAHF